ncbi:hypothetical protein CBM2589_U10157 [Cupriavidus taiwanensis]|uniref:Uncharacterized protein n=1 Tax=Cupriavidus taiwanensis TaxID=164546 RepID=A0A375CQG8_9BURK|nr:hypothetical protein CBM2589_U10157 [Cupriavidus taiwanensis]
MHAPRGIEALHEASKRPVAGLEFSHVAGMACPAPRTRAALSVIAGDGRLLAEFEATL